MAEAWSGFLRNAVPAARYGNTLRYLKSELLQKIVIVQPVEYRIIKIGIETTGILRSSWGLAALDPSHPPVRQKEVVRAAKKINYPSCHHSFRSYSSAQETTKSSK